MSQAPQTPQSPSRLNRYVTWILVAIGAVVVLLVLTDIGPRVEEIGFGQVIEDAQAGKIDTVKVEGTDVTVTYLPVGDAEPARACHSRAK